MTAIHPLFSPVQQAEYEASGFVRLGKILPEERLQAMRDRLDGAPTLNSHAGTAASSPLNTAS